MSSISTHILDTSKGMPAAGVKVTLEKFSKAWVKIGENTTDSDGRIKKWLGGIESANSDGIEAGDYRLVFCCEDYFVGNNVTSFYKEIPIEFVIEKNNQHYHVPLLLNPFGYSTYRGS